MVGCKPSCSKGKKAMSLERQVRIAAGSLVVIGAALGHFVAPVWFGLSAFVGAGLVFAGVTDTCGMGMLIAVCPGTGISKLPDLDRTLGNGDLISLFCLMLVLFLHETRNHGWQLIACQ